MQIPRRTFLGFFGQAAVAHAVPRPMLRMAGAFNPAPQAPLIPGHVIEAVVGGLNDSWDNFATAFGLCTEFSDTSRDTVHQTVTNSLNAHLPPLLGAIGKFRDIKAKIMPGDPEQDEKIVKVLADAFDIRKRANLESLVRLANLLPIDEAYDFVEPVDWDLSPEEINRRYSPYVQLTDLKMYATVIRAEIEDSDDYYPSEIKKDFVKFLFRLTKAGLVDDGVKTSLQSIQGTADLAVKELCKPLGLCAETIKCLSSNPIDCCWLREDEFYGLFGDTGLFEEIADTIGAQAHAIFRYLEIPWETADYIKADFPATVQNLYRQHFQAAMPDVATIPMPRINLSSIFSQAANTKAASVQPAEEAMVSEQSASLEVTETTAAETGMELAELPSALPPASAVLTRIADRIDVTDAIDQLCAENKTPSQPGLQTALP